MIDDPRIWAGYKPMTLHISQKHVFVEYAISYEDDAMLRDALAGDLDIPLEGCFVEIYCIRDHYRDEGELPKAQWAYGGKMPAARFVELYYPVEGW